MTTTYAFRTGRELQIDDYVMIAEDHTQSFATVVRIYKNPAKNMSDNNLLKQILNKTLIFAKKFNGEAVQLELDRKYIVETKI
jgi:hypothetical protein